MRSALGAFALALGACSSPPPPPVAPPPPPVIARPIIPVVVVDLDFDDATEDQAEALTAALRSRVGGMPGWRLDAQRPSMTTLLPAFSCPRPPDASCLDRIGKLLEVDHYFWGTVTKAAAPDDVVAEIHYWGRGEIEQVARETYSDNLTDQNDDALRRIAFHLVEQLDARRKAEKPLTGELSGADPTRRR
ncbi:MAG TPA: hypothetical protein VLM85_12500 [Polyangiaceae bacterium]|nr:hypothetical protein [Polyangiaceae bacterium]